MKIKICVILCLSFFATTSFGQKNELGKVTKEELQEKFYKEDTSAVACILFKKAKTTFRYHNRDGYKATTEFDIKIKVYKKEGFNWANFDIPYYIGYENLNDEYVEIVSGFTYNLENNQIVKEKIGAQSQFKEKINEYWAKKIVTFPNVKEGSIIELKYQYKSQNLNSLPEFQFQYKIPVKYAEFKTVIPEFYLYKRSRSGYAHFDFDQKLEKGSQNFEDDNNHTVFISFNQINSTFTAKNVAAIIEEDYTNNINNYYSTIYHELETYRWPNEKPKHFSTTWETITKSIYKDDGYEKELQKIDFFLNDLNTILKGATSHEERLRAVFYNVKNTMNWNKMYGYSIRKGIQNAYKEKTGNSAEINAILLSMLKMAGIEAYPILLSTRENGVASFPNKNFLNYVIVGAIIDGKTILLDATDKNADINILPLRALNTIGRLMKNDGSSEEIDLMPKTNSLLSVNLMAQINENGIVTGKVRQQYFDYLSYYYNSNFKGISKESIIDNIERKYHGLDITEYDAQNVGSNLKPVVENYSFTNNNLVESVGNNFYFSPLLFFSKNINPFKLEKREYPVDYGFPFQEKYSFSITIPSNYSIESIPESKSLSMPDNLGKFAYTISKNNNQVQLQYVFDINKAIIKPHYYEALKNFYKEMVNKQTEKIGLKKND